MSVEKSASSYRLVWGDSDEPPRDLPRHFINFFIQQTPVEELILTFGYTTPPMDAALGAGDDENPTLQVQPVARLSCSMKTARALHVSLNAVFGDEPE